MLAIPAVRNGNYWFCQRLHWKRWLGSPCVCTVSHIPYSHKPSIVLLLLLLGAALEHSPTVQPGDELLQVHTTLMQGLTRFEAWNIIKTLPDGPINAVIKRKNSISKPTASLHGEE